MTPISSVSPLTNAASLARLDAPLPKPALNLSGTMPQTSGADGFGTMIDNLVSTVDAKDAAAQLATKQVLMGKSDQMHQSVIAMQEASVAFNLMVEVRNKLVDSYQELMRMQV